MDRRKEENDRSKYINMSVHSSTKHFWLNVSGFIFTSLDNPNT